MWKWTGVVAVVVLVGMWAGFVRTAQAALTESWSAPTSLSTSSSEIDDADVQVSEGGARATAVWKYWNGSHAVIQSASATITGNSASWGSVTDLSSPALTSWESRVALSGDGTTALAVWTTSGGLAQAAVGSINGQIATWSTPSTISVDGKFADGAPDVTLSVDGRLATVAWAESDTSTFRVKARSAAITGSSATWGAATWLSSADFDASTPKLAASSDGSRVTAAWIRGLNSFDTAPVQSASAAVTVAGGQTWGTPVDLTDEFSSREHLVVESSSDGTEVSAAWLENTSVVQTIAATVAGSTNQTWGTAMQVGGTNSSSVDLDRSADGDVATVVWGELSSGDVIMRAASGVVTGTAQTWGSVADLSATGESAADPEVSLSADGIQVTAAWSRGSAVQASSAIVDGTSANWETATTLSGAGTSTHPVLALSRDGARATTLWRRLDASYVIQSSSAAVEVPELGTEWTAVTDTSSNRTFSLATDDSGTWVSGGVFGDRISTDNGLTWDDIPALPSGGYVQRVAWCSGGERFIAKITTSGKIGYSSDGETWTEANLPGSVSDVSNVACDGTTAVALRDGGFFGPVAAYSTDSGQTWSAASGSVSDEWTYVTPAPGIGFVAVGAQMDPASVVRSSNGSSWSSATGQSGTWAGVAASPEGDLVAVGTGVNRVMTSPDAQTWTARTPSAANDWQAVTNAAGSWFAVSSNGTEQVMTSPDGITWTAQSAAAVNNWNSLAFGVTDSGTLATGRLMAGRQAIGDTVNVMYSDAYQPGPPLQPAATPGDEEVSVTFSAPSYRGAAITDYEYSVDGGAWTSADTTASPITITGLTNDVATYIRLRAVNGVAAGDASDTVTVTPTATPTNPVDPGEDAGVLTWSPPAWASPVTQYVVVYRQQGSSAKWGVYAARTTSWPGALPTEVTLDATVGDCATNAAAGWDYCPLPRGVLVGGTTYQFKVFARTATALGKYSDTVAYLAPEGGAEGLAVPIGGDWGADPNGEPPVDPDPTPEPTAGTPTPTPRSTPPPDKDPVVAPDPLVPPDAVDRAPRSTARTAAVRHLRVVRGRVTWKTPASVAGARFLVRVKKARWGQWRQVGRRTSLTVGPRVRAVKVRAVVPDGRGPVSTLRRVR